MILEIPIGSRIKTTNAKVPGPSESYVRGFMDRDCEYKFLDTADGTRDKYCPRCGKRAKQGVMYFKESPNVTININVTGELKENTVETIVKEINKQMRRCYGNV